jgi:hypothetical protein
MSSATESFVAQPAWHRLGDAVREHGQQLGRILGREGSIVRSATIVRL